jgi:hypothetical protein
MALLDDLKTYINALLAWSPGVSGWGSNFLGFLTKCRDTVDDLYTGKADADHSHGAGGEVISIGTSDARPAVANGYIHSETDEGQLAVLDASGKVVFLVSPEQYALVADFLG